VITGNGGDHRGLKKSETRKAVSQPTANASATLNDISANAWRPEYHNWIAAIGLRGERDAYC
jgi:hypothetical protein